MISLPWVPFRWQHARLGDQEFPYAALFLPGTLPTLDGLSGWFQFDLGFPMTILYGGSLSLEQRQQVTGYPRWPDAITFKGKKLPLLHMPLQIGPWETERIACLEDFGDAIADDGRPVLGTVGVDLVRSQILVIDFPGQRMARLETVPQRWDEQLHWVPLRFTETGQILIQITVDSEPHWAMYDSGSSLFHILTDAAHWQQLAGGEITETFPASSWGERLEVKGGPPRVNVAMGDHPLAIPIVHYMDYEAGQRFLEEHNAVGVLGNVPFLDYQLILDFPHERVALSPNL